MNRLTLKLTDKRKQKLCVEVDGVRLVPTRDEAGRNVYTYETEASEVDVRLYSEPNELLAHHWFLRYLYYYFISLFGLFDWSYSCNGIMVDYRARYSITADTVLDFKWNKVEKNGKVFKLKDGEDDIIDNDTNIYTEDVRIKRRYIGAVAFKVLTWIALIVTIILIIMR